jgi:hypothetical protein
MVESRLKEMLAASLLNNGSILNAAFQSKCTSIIIQLFPLKSIWLPITDGLM